MFSAMGYLSIVFVLLLIKLFNASVAEAVKSVRKVSSQQPARAGSSLWWQVATICLSFLFFGKTITSMHVVGMMLFVSSVGLGMKTKMTAGPGGAKPSGSPTISPASRPESEELLANPPESV